MKKYPAVLFALLAFALFWAAAAALVNRPFLPGPLATFRTLAALGAAGRLPRHLVASLSRILWALATSSVPAAAIGIVAGRSARVNRFVSPVIYLIHPLPKAAFLPIIILMLGLGEASKIFLTGFIIFSQVLVTMRDAAGRVSEELLDAVRSFGAGKAALVRHVVIPSVLPAFFSGIRVSIGTATATLFFAETFASESGLGWLIMDAWTRVAYDEMYAAIAALSLLGLALFMLADFTEIVLCPWLRKTA